MYRYIHFPESLDASRQTRPCHGRNDALNYTEGDADWNEEQLEQTLIMLSQKTKTKPGPWFSLNDAQEKLKTGGIGFVESVLNDPTASPSTKRAHRRTLHLFQTMATRMQTLLDQLVSVGALERKQ
jgi:hypothetical protein